MKKKLIYLIAAVTLAAAVCGVKPTRSGAAPFDQSKTGSLTIHPMEVTDEAMAQDVLSAKAKVDIFQVAKAVKTPGYDTYHYEFIAPFDRAEMKDRTPEKAEDWDTMAQEAARVIFDGDTKVNPVKQGTLDKTSSVSDLEPGLYLLMARGGKGTDSVADFRKDVTDDEGKTTIVTYANSNQYEYTFKPQLVSLPMRDSDVPVNPTDDPPNTADQGDWSYDLNVYLKFERSVRFGSLKIRKVLSSYESEIPNDPVTFVFQVDGETPGAEGAGGELSSYHGVDSLTFTAAGEEEIIFERIPVTAVLTVSEVYSGSGYEIAPDTGGTVREGITISADQDTVVEIPFVNVHNDDLKRGHGIKNQFTYTDSGLPGGQPGRWNWVQDPVNN